MFSMAFPSYPFYISTVKPIEPQTVEVSVKIEEPDSRQIKNSKQSLFHNYQKHLLVTLKQIVDHSKLTNSGAQDIWINFLDSRTYSTKNMYEILFGNKYVGGINEFLFAKYHFQKILNKYSHEQIQQAQQILREVVLQRFQNNSMEELLKFRRLNDKKRNNLKLVITQFVQQLKDGKFQKRIPKEKKRVIQNNWNVSQRT